MKIISIIGSGLYGITLANILSDYFHINIYEKRGHIGGQCYDYVDEQTGILTPKYGPHIFHINSPGVMSYVTKFTSFNNYRHQVKITHDGRIYDFPINLSTLNMFFNSALTPREMKNYLKKYYKPDVQFDNLEDKLISMVGKEIYEAFFLSYTEKQWGRHPKFLSPEIISRIPIHMNYRTTYYKKRFNGMPIGGYTAMFKKMLDKKGINIFLNTDFYDNRKWIENADLVLHTGEIDRYFEYAHGKLGYRGLKFVFLHVPTEDFQGVAVMNYPDSDVAYTRICEPKHFYPENEELFRKEESVIIHEIPCEGADDMRFYPVPDPKNRILYDKYAEMARKFPKIRFCGRLGSYKYYDMENCIEDALKEAKEIVSFLGKER